MGLAVAAALCLPLVAAVALCLPTMAVAAPMLCGKRADFLRQLDASHGEAPSAIGLTGSGRVIEVLTSDAGSWTIIVTGPDGTSCLIAAGEAWQTLDRAPGRAPGREAGQEAGQDAGGRPGEDS